MESSVTYEECSDHLGFVFGSVLLPRDISDKDKYPYPGSPTVGYDNVMDL